jgi:hypothetical protein
MKTNFHVLIIQTYGRISVMLLILRQANPGLGVPLQFTLLNLPLQ